MRRTKGFTAIELMIVIAIIGILAAVVIPAIIDQPKEEQEKEIIYNGE